MNLGRLDLSLAGARRQSGVSYSAAALAFFARLPSTPTTEEKGRYDRFFRATAAVLPKLEGLYLFRETTDEAVSRQNLAQNAYHLTVTGSPTWARATGWTGASGGYLNTGYNASTVVGGKYKQNDASLFAWGLSSQTLAGAIIGTSGSQSYIYPRLTDGAAQLRACGLSSGLDTTQDGTGFLLVTRTNGVADSYRNGVLLATANTSSAAPDNSNFTILTRATGYYLGACAAAGFGGALSQAEQLVLYNAMFDFFYDGYDVFAIAGQSNCYSGGTLSTTTDVSGGYCDQWFTDRIIGGNEPIQQNGTTLSITAIGFAVAMMREGYGPNRLAGTRRKALLVGNALGSTAMSGRWAVGGDLYLATIAKVNAAIASKTGNRLAGILWHQGEADAGRTEAAYAADLDAVVAGFRSSLTGGSAATPFLCGGLADAFLSANANAAGVQAALTNIASRVPNSAFVSAVGIASDTIHFSAAGQRNFGPLWWTAYSGL